MLTHCQLIHHGFLHLLLGSQMWVIAPSACMIIFFSDTKIYLGGHHKGAYTLFGPEIELYWRVTETTVTLGTCHVIWKSLCHS